MVRARATAHDAVWLTDAPATKCPKSTLVLKGVAFESATLTVIARLALVSKAEPERFLKYAKCVVGLHLAI